MRVYELLQFTKLADDARWAIVAARNKAKQIGLEMCEQHLERALKIALRATEEIQRLEVFAPGGEKE